jgi:hypothetical protein
VTEANTIELVTEKFVHRSQVSEYASRARGSSSPGIRGQTKTYGQVSDLQFEDKVCSLEFICNIATAHFKIFVDSSMLIG